MQEPREGSHNRASCGGLPLPDPEVPSPLQSKLGEHNAFQASAALTRGIRPRWPAIWQPTCQWVDPQVRMGSGSIPAGGLSQPGVCLWQPNMALSAEGPMWDGACPGPGTQWYVVCPSENGVCAQRRDATCSLIESQPLSTRRPIGSIESLSPQGVSQKPRGTQEPVAQARSSVEKDLCDGPRPQLCERLPLPLKRDVGDL